MVQAPTLRRFIQEELGYPLEKHVYMTEDGYINTVYRIPAPKNAKNVVYDKPVVIYQHGLMDCCNSILADEEESIGLRLVNAGYDLWINNSRGNRYSRDHQDIDVDSCKWEQIYKYWEFSFSEMATFDQPALWSYVMKKTGTKKITYIGHSQGTT